jgi:hypothetical protein
VAKLSSPDYETVSPYAFLRSLPTIASNKIPADLQRYCQVAGFEPWNLLEEAVYFFFRHIFMLHTIKLGANTLFKHEPEGIVLWDRCGERNAFLYECKARENGYKITLDDLLRYKDYIRVKKHEIRVRHHMPLTHLLVISSEFHGDIQSRLKEIDMEGVIFCLITAECLKLLYERSRDMEFENLHLLSLARMFCRGQLCEAHIQKAIGEHQ